MIVIYLLYFIYSVCADQNASKEVLEDLRARTTLDAEKCQIQDVVENNCMRCICDGDGAYYCTAKACDEKVNIIFGIPNKGRCNPHNVYQYNLITCVCNGRGYWPHERCERLKTLESTIRKTRVVTKRPPIEKVPVERCEPNTYVSKDCNVCRCGANGFIEQCTKNDCKAAKVRRRAINSVQGSCVPNTWYSLAPCQFCYCVHANKLVCSTGNTHNEKLELGAYNLTVCGADLIKQVVELIPDGLKALREGNPPQKNLTLVATTPPTTPYYRTTVQSSSRPYDSEPYLLDNFQMPYEKPTPGVVVTEPTKPVETVEYESSEENITLNGESPMRPASSTQLPYDDDEDDGNGSESNEVDNDNGFARLPGVSFDPKYSFQVVGSASNSMSLPVSSPPPQPQQLQAQQLMQQFLFPASTPVPPPVNRMPLNMITPSTTPDPNVVKIHLPLVLDRLIQMALRKSMVKINATAKCTPGETTQDNCNYCFCLNNGKMLCTDKKC